MFSITSLILSPVCGIEAIGLQLKASPGQLIQVDDGQIRLGGHIHGQGNFDGDRC